MSGSPYTTDTSPEAYAVQLDLLRRMIPAHRLKKAVAWSRQLRQMAFEAIRRRHPELDELQVRMKFLEQTYGTELAESLRRSPIRRSEYLDEADFLVAALAPVANALRSLGIRHYVGGSVASSFHGATRSTMDVNLVCELTERDVAAFITLIGADFYSSESAVRDALRRKACFNLIHCRRHSRSTSSLVAVVRSTWNRCACLLATVGGSPDRRRADSHPRGLDYQQTGVVSLDERIVRPSVGRRFSATRSTWRAADRDYLRRAAQSVGVDDLLDRLMNV